jgi:hypothetical protein
MTTDFGFYPPAPAGGSNGVGEFEIGVSAVGTIAPFNWRQTVISQYANSPTLLQLIENLNAYLDQTQNLDTFFDLIWNVDTAVGYGLDCWGRIVGVNRILHVASGDYFGFKEAAPGAEPFGVAPFYSGAPLTSNYSLSDAAYRLLIMAKAAANITNGAIPAINQILLNLFPNRGNCYVAEGSPTVSYFGFAESTTADSFNVASFYSGGSFSRMIMQYVFEFQLTPVELAIVQNSGVLPRPAGVQATVVINP